MAGTAGPRPGGAYTPSLTITSATTLYRERRLPLPGQVHVAVGDRVTARQVVASTSLPGRVTALHVARELNLPPEEIARWLLKQPGDAVEQGEPLAESRSLFGLFRSQALSPTSGTLETVSGVTGQAFIRGEPLPVELTAYVDGTVVTVEPGESVTVQCACALVQGILGLGGEAYGELVVLADEAGQSVGAGILSDRHRGSVLICGAFLDYGFLQRAREVGVAGLVVAAMPAADLDRLLGRPLGVAITGQEQIGLTLILTEGFGHQTMAQETFELLRSHQGRPVSLNGATQIRAGVLRPEVIMPLAEQTRAAVAAPVAGQLAAGSRVRLVGAPYLGRLGIVTELPAEPQRLETEARVRVLRARLDDDLEVLVPRANVELVTR